MSEYRFVAHSLQGMEGMVRGLFANRSQAGSVASKLFPGINNVAILPTMFAEESAATDYLKPLLEQGGNAAAVKLAENNWLICAWVSD